MQGYDITFHGCDEVWHFGVELDNRDAALLQRIARMSEDLHGFSCEPYMTVTESTEVTE